MVDLANILKSPIPRKLMEIATKIAQAGGELYIVGGWVRDTLRGQKTKDFDLEVHRLGLEPLLSILKPYGHLNLIGRSFGVVQLTMDHLDCQFALARTESKTGKGHRGFVVENTMPLSFKDAALRRDFTINAMGVKLPERELCDPCYGLEDLKAGIIRHVSEAFSEDPLRALRAVQFAARFEFTVAEETKFLCGQQELGELARERIFGEIKKLLLQATKPSIGFKLLSEMGLLRFFPEINALQGVVQDAVWHPEGDVFVHTMMVIDQAAKIGREQLMDQEYKRLVLMLAALCHDLGKPECTVIGEDGRVRSHNHDARGVPLTEAFLSRLCNEQNLIDEVKTLVLEHLRPAQLYKEREHLSKSAIRRLALRVNITDLVRVARADHLGRSTEDAINGVFEAGDWLLQEAANLSVETKKPENFLRGQDLVDLGFAKSPQIGKILAEAFELQLEGELSSREEALAWLKKKRIESIRPSKGNR